MEGTKFGFRCLYCGSKWPTVGAMMRHEDGCKAKAERQAEWKEEWNRAVARAPKGAIVERRRWPR